ncbi:hypothetical protein M2437_004836 [Methylorubrum pseudosasae]|nr:hypothetical protein [Methylorubrum pseudosasae]
MGEAGEIREHHRRVGARVVLGANLGEGGRHIAAHHRLEQIDDARAVGEAQHVAHARSRDRARPVGDGLIEQRKRIAHRALGGAGDGGERLVLGLHPFRGADLLQVGGEHVGLDSAQVEALAARQDRHRNLTDLGGREHELGVGRRLLQRLQEGVERLLREHVDLVDDVDLVAGRDRRVADAVDDAAHIVDAGMRGGVHLQHVHVPGFHDRLAVLAEFRHRHGGAGIRLPGAQVVEAAGEDAGGGRLADAAHAREHPGLRDAVGRKGVAQRAHHGALADQVIEGLRAIFSRQHPVRRRGRHGRGGGHAGQARLVGERAVRLVHAAVRIFGRGRAVQLKRTARVGGWTKTRSVSLGLLPSGPDPVGE